MKVHIFLLLSLVACLSFTAFGGKQHLVILYDSLRDIYVMLTETEAYFNWGIGSDPDADYWNLIGENPTGTWTSDTRFTDQTGYFEQAKGDNWVEKQTSGVVHNFVRVQPGETVQKATTVNRTATQDHLVVLYDESRNIYVMLTDTEAYFNWGIGSDPDAIYWNLIGENPTGTWTSDTRFTDQTGYFEQAEGDNWVEKQDSGVVHHFVRVQPGEEPQSTEENETSAEYETFDGFAEDHLVVLYDESRNIFVMLTDTQAFFNWGIGSDPDADYWNLIGENPTGTWTSDTRFTEQTGYFEQAKGDNWVEKQTSGDTHHFVRVQPGEVITVNRTSTQDHLVVLYDESRDIYVMLTDTEAYFNWGVGSDPDATYWTLIGENPTGTWTSDKRFTDQTGYFEQVEKNKWVEKQDSGVVHNFVRVN